MGELHDLLLHFLFCSRFAVECILRVFSECSRPKIHFMCVLNVLEICSYKDLPKVLGVCSECKNVDLQRAFLPDNDVSYILVVGDGDGDQMLRL